MNDDTNLSDACYKALVKAWQLKSILVLLSNSAGNDFAKGSKIEQIETLANGLAVAIELADSLEEIVERDIDRFVRAIQN